MAATRRPRSCKAKATAARDWTVRDLAKDLWLTTVPIWD